MARQLRLQIEDGIYHVYHRGNARQSIFHDDRDRIRYLRALREARDRCGWSVLTYCLMSNHYHLVVRTPLPNLADGMRHVNSTYAQSFNRRYEKDGHVFQGRYGSRLVQRDEHLLTTLAYVARNPVEAGLCERPEDWRWSGHRAIVGLSDSRIVDVAGTLSLLAETRPAALAAYVSAVVKAGPDLPEARGGIIVGNARFAAAAMQSAQPASSEIPRRQRLAGRPDLEDLVARGEDGLADAYFRFGYTQREIAERLGCHYSTICRRLRAREHEDATRKT
jgi:REP element-mobilizing transposase RayT